MVEFITRIEFVKLCNDSGASIREGISLYEDEYDERYRLLMKRRELENLFVKHYVAFTEAMELHRFGHGGRKEIISLVTKYYGFSKEKADKLQLEVRRLSWKDIDYLLSL